MDYYTQHSEMNTTFSGFSLPEGAWLPPELIALLPRLGKAQLKCLIVIIARFTQQAGDEPTTLTELELLTGLARKSVIAALRDLLTLKIITRTAVGRTYIYEPMVQISHQQVVKLSNKKEREIQSDSPSLSLDSLDSLEQLKSLRACGVYVRTAREIVNKFDPQEIEKHLSYYDYALKVGFAKGPGWLVNSIIENWGEPIGYRDHPIGKERRQYSDW